MRIRYLFTIAIVFLLYSGTATAQSDAPTAQAQTVEQKLEKTRALIEQNKLTPSQAPKPAEDSNTSPVIRMFQSLGLLVALVLIGAWIYKKVVLKDTPVVSRKMKLLERIPLAPRASLYLAEVEGNKILVGLTADGISMMKLGSTIELTEEYTDA